MISNTRKLGAATTQRTIEIEHVITEGTTVTTSRAGEGVEKAFIRLIDKTIGFHGRGN